MTKEKEYADRKCPQCGTNVPGKEKKCPECGTQVGRGGSYKGYVKTRLTKEGKKRWFKIPGN